MAANEGETKVKLWSVVCYPENMREDWEEEIDDILQVPYAYATHDIDKDTKSKHRKDHVHLIIVWRGNTTARAMINVANRLSAEGKKCCSTAEPVNDIRHCYDYLIHDTDSCRKKGKELYPESIRHEGNNFDIGALEQLTTAQKEDMLFEVIGEQFTHNFETINELTMYILQNYPIEYRKIIKDYNPMLTRYCMGSHQRAKQMREAKKNSRKSEE